MAFVLSTNFEPADVAELLTGSGADPVAAEIRERAAAVYGHKATADEQQAIKRRAASAYSRAAERNDSDGNANG